MLDHVGAKKAIWVGHDWGSSTLWNIAAHFPERCTAAISLAIPFGTQGFGGRTSRIDRERYPEESDPFGQFDYMAFYEQNPRRVTGVFDANPASTVRYFFRRGDPAVLTRRAPSSNITRDGGWFGGADQAPDVPLDRAILDDNTYAALTSALRTNGFHGPPGYYLNHADNARYAESALHEGRLDMPVQFVGAEYDDIADIHVPSAHTAMRDTCRDLTESVVSAGHWLQLEKPDEVNQLIEDWLHTKNLVPTGQHVRVSD
ncbi:alpha/beta fold hydrolase [Actinopolymorpha pittospori]|uniref:alpha/beta fold hydrolase n=1 Tax=Actinopolymorpha pittospori TaxID=648752 RepID=UPI00192DBB7B|nr:alpha/beta hydrolase [Actinopolymorpha pittospori]